ncbi:hypothetical protein HMPREF1869_01330 [Bacteroidales bacterium KA00251]|nr:hypothetical protein HMPREF1869_01330 [Bacteroidales bacterium KA00251]
MKKSTGAFGKISRNFLENLSELFRKYLGTFSEISRNFLKNLQVLFGLRN